jgi:nickel transport protein
MNFAVKFAALLALTGMFLCLAAPAGAHKVSVFAYVENGRIMGEGYFADGAKAQGAAVTVTDASGRELAKAETGRDGAFSLPLPSASAPLTVIIMASEGHRNQYVLTAADIGAASQAPGPTSGQASAQPAAQAPVASAAAASAPAVRTPDAAELAEAVDKLVEARLAPIKAQLARLVELGDKVGVKDVVGGLGWILGLFGVAAYFASRRNAMGRDTTGPGEAGRRGQ